MARLHVDVEGQPRTVALDDARVPQIETWALLRTRVVDEVTGVPPRQLRIVTGTPRVQPRVGDDGLCGLIGRPRAVAGALLTDGALNAEVSAPGYLPRVLDAAIDAARRRLTTAAAQGADALDVAPPDPVPPRSQFRPGRGVLVERAAGADDEEFLAVRALAAAPADAQVAITPPLAAPRALRVPPWRLTGVPIELPEQRLHRAGVTAVGGRALRQPAAGALPVPVVPAQFRLGVVGLWWTDAEVHAASSPPHGPDLLALGVALAFDHAAGAPLQACTLAAAGPQRSLRGAAAAGARELLLHPWSGLAVGGGDVLQVEAAGAQRELVTTAAFTAPVDAQLPARVPITTPLAFPHPALAPVQAQNETATSSLPALAREAQRGDRVLFAAGPLAAAPTELALRIDTGSRAERCLARCLPSFDSIADTFAHGLQAGTDGRFALPPLARVARLRVVAAHDGQAALPAIDLALDPTADNVLPILFTP